MTTSRPKSEIKAT